MSNQRVNLFLWAKADRGNNRFHPLLCHMLDVAALAGLIWDHHFTWWLRRRLECALGAEARSLVMFLAGVHDIGKATPSWQKKDSKLSQLFGLRISENDQSCPHGFISAHVLEEFLGPCSASTLLARIAGGHHGVFPRSSDLRMGHDTLGNKDWKGARYTLLNEFAKVLGLDFKQISQSNVEIVDPIIVPLLAGFISVVDWIGSNEKFFPYFGDYGKSLEVNVAEYWKNSQERARTSLEMLGWVPAVTFAQETQFGGVFPKLNPNSLQNTVSELASRQSSPYLMIVEAPMAQGKTEAALYSADLAMCRGFARGMYMAMPTQATSNAMYKRVLDDYLRQRGHTGKLNLQLVHGNALLAQMKEVKEGENPAFGPKNVCGNEESSDTEAQSWFTAQKRPLLAPFGVGTIDQSLLSVLKTKHWFVRLFGLAGKVIIFDEVHAYDAYTSTILERLLRWLSEIDCTVILLSATLPEAKRKALASAYSGRNDADYKRYPRITLAHAYHHPSGQADQATICEEVAMGDARCINVHFATTDLGDLTATLAQRLVQGGCVAVICNTVDRSIEVYKHLRDNLKETECSLFHARTLQMWRREREEEVLRKFGKGEKQADGMYVNLHRPNRAVLVATQVIEQSLDLDFDLMVSEIAPIDLLLQRMGRLHRHPRLRPQILEKSGFIILCDAHREGPPPETFGKSIECVYDRYILLRTWLTLRKRNRLEIPTEIEGLVEAVYKPDDSTMEDGWTNALAEAKRRMKSEQTESEKVACQLLVSKPRDPADMIDDFNDQLTDDENPEVHKAVRAATREGDPSITVVVVEANTMLKSEPNIADVRYLLDHSVKLSHRGVFTALVKNGVTPQEWAKNAHLRYSRLLRLNGQNQVAVGKFVLGVDERLGIVIEKEM